MPAYGGMPISAFSKALPHGTERIKVGTKIPRPPCNIVRQTEEYPVGLDPRYPAIP